MNLEEHLKRDAETLETYEKDLQRTKDRNRKHWKYVWALVPVVVAVLGLFAFEREQALKDQLKKAMTLLEQTTNRYEKLSKDHAQLQISWIALCQIYKEEVAERGWIMNPFTNRNCEECDEPIPVERLLALPETTTCVKCSNVPKPMGLMDYDHKTAPTFVRLDPTDTESLRKAQLYNRRDHGTEGEE